MEHRVKCWPEYYAPIVAYQKHFDLRRDDRDYQVGDTLILEEWNERGGYTGSVVVCRITYILRTFPGLVDGYCILSLEE